MSVVEVISCLSVCPDTSSLSSMICNLNSRRTSPRLIGGMRNNQAENTNYINTADDRRLKRNRDSPCSENESTLPSPEDVQLPSWPKISINHISKTRFVSPSRRLASRKENYVNNREKSIPLSSIPNIDNRSNHQGDNNVCPEAIKENVNASGCCPQSMQIHCSKDDFSYAFRAFGSCSAHMPSGANNGVSPQNTLIKGEPPSTRVRQHNNTITLRPDKSLHSESNHQ